MAKRRASLFSGVLTFSLLAGPTTALAQDHNQPAETPPEAPQPPPPAPPTPPPPHEHAEHHHRHIRLQVESNRPGAVVERRASTREETGVFIILPWKSTEKVWEPVCVAPCRIDVDPYATYRISGQNGISGSGEFTLPQKSDALKLNIDTGDRRGHVVGQALTAGGTVALIVGGLLLATASKFSNESEARIAGGITGGVGLAAMAVGIPLTIATRTKVSTDDGHEIPFLPRKIKLGGGFVLTQKGITF